MKKFLMIAALVFAAVSASAQIRVEVGYLTQKEKVGGDTSDDAMNGIKLGGYYMIEDLVSDLPIVAEAGVTFSLGKHKEDGWTTKYSNFAVPVNGGWKISINDEFSVRPYAGINLKFNTMLKGEGGGAEYDAFDDGDAKRFQLGGQLGAVVQWKQFTASYQYQGDWTSMYSDGDKCSIPNSAICVGIIF